MRDSPSKGSSPSASIAPHRASNPTHQPIPRQSVFWNEQANKTHEYKAIGFVFEAFIPAEGKDQRKEPGVLTARDAIAKEPAEKDFPCCALALRVQRGGSLTSEHR